MRRNSTPARRLHLLIAYLTFLHNLTGCYPSCIDEKVDKIDLSKLARSHEKEREKEHEAIILLNTIRPPTCLQKLRARSTWHHELSILDFLLYLLGRLSADPHGDGEDIVNMNFVGTLHESFCRS